MCIKIQKRNKQIETQSQDGLSIIKTIGILLIITVLTIGGLVGFRYTMNYYQTKKFPERIADIVADSEVMTTILQPPYLLQAVSTTSASVTLTTQSPTEENSNSEVMATIL